MLKRNVGARAFDARRTCAKSPLFTPASESCECPFEGEAILETPHGIQGYRMASYSPSLKPGVA